MHNHDEAINNCYLFREENEKEFKVCQKIKTLV